METNNYSAEFGRASGAVVNVSINSGTNQLHGKLWEYHRNTILNAIGPFAPPINKLTGKSQKPDADPQPVRRRSRRTDSARSSLLLRRLRRQSPGAGAIRSGNRADRSTAPGYLPDHHRRTRSAAQSDHRHSLRKRHCSAVGLDAARDAVINALPSPNVPGFSNNYVSFPRATLTDNKGDGRLDYILSTKTTIFGRYSDHKGDIVDATTIPGDAGDGGNGTIHAYNRQIAAGITHAFGPNSTLDARIGFTWTHGGKMPYLAGQESLNTEAGVPGLPTDKAVVRRLSNESVKNFSTWGAQTSNPQFQNPFVINPKLNYSLDQGTPQHEIRLGISLRSTPKSTTSTPSMAAKHSARDSARTAAAPATQARVQAAYLTDFLTGARDSYQLNNFRIVNYHQYMNYFYFQDDWKAAALAHGQRWICAMNW